MSRVYILAKNLYFFPPPHPAKSLFLTLIFHWYWPLIINFTALKCLRMSSYALQCSRIRISLGFLENTFTMVEENFENSSPEMLQNSSQSDCFISKNHIYFTSKVSMNHVKRSGREETYWFFLIIGTKTNGKLLSHGREQTNELMHTSWFHTLLDWCWINLQWVAPL